MTKTRTPKATVRLNAWELLSIEEALRNGLTHVDQHSLNALIEKIANARVK
jgi:hypothetical protein